MMRRARSIAVLGFLLGGAIGIISSTQTWLTVTRADGAAELLVPGASALPLLAPLSLAVLALGAALSIVGPVLRYVFALLAAAGAVLLITMTVPLAFAPPIAAVAPTVTEATGLAGDEAMRDIIAVIAPTAWPSIALVGWALLFAAAVFTLVTARGWKRGGRRYQADADAHNRNDGPLDPVDSWDELSHGTDPTS